jgi:hypothetical protein
MLKVASRINQTNRFCQTHSVEKEKRDASVRFVPCTPRDRLRVEGGGEGRAPDRGSNKRLQA